MHNYYLLIGGGRVARHFAYYFSNVNLSFATWQRADGEQDLQNKLKNVSHILLLIKDQAIDEFILTHLTKVEALLIHFSGSLVSAYAHGMHPLMTFSRTLYAPDFYKTIPFVIDENGPSFTDVFPTLVNPHAQLNPKLKEKYHALCVMSGNFSCLLWQAFFSKLEKDFNIPASFGKLYLEKQTENILANYKKSLTGPLIRNDHHTIKKNLTALADDPLQDLYQAFIHYYKRRRNDEYF